MDSEIRLDAPSFAHIVIATGKQQSGNYVNHSKEFFGEQTKWGKEQLRRGS